MKNKWLAFFLMTLFCLMGCKEKHTKLYLMTHPQVLKGVVEQCQSEYNQTDGDKCKMAEVAADEFNDLLNDQQNNPERFGENILQQEIACAELKSNPQAEQNKVRDTCNHIKVLLAVVGLSSPE